MFNPKRGAVLKTVACLALLMTVGTTYSLIAQTRTTNVATEKWIIKQIANGDEAHLEQAFPKHEDRKLSGSFIQKLLTNKVPGVNVGRRGIHIYDAVISDPIDLRDEEIPYTFSLSNCTFESDVTFRNAHIKGDINADNSRFKRVADFEDIQSEGDAFFRNVDFEGAVTFFGAQVSRHFDLDDSDFTARSTIAEFENVHVGMNAFFRKVVFAGPVDFQSMYVEKNALFNEVIFDSDVNFFIAEIKKDFVAVGAQFKSTIHDANFFGLKVGGNAIFNNAIFAGGFTLVKADVGGNLEFENAKALNPERTKSLSGLKADNILFDGAQFAPPYWLNSMSYRLISYNMQDDALLSFVGNSGYKSDVYSTLESHYQKTGDIYAARDVHVAWKNQERNGTFTKAPLRYVWMWVQYITTGYGRYLVRALLWALLFIIIGCIVFWREDGMETQNVNDAQKYEGRYHPIWYSLATFLPIVKLPDASIWTPKPQRKGARLYLRLHIILGYLLIPIGLAAWTGIIK